MRERDYVLAVLGTATTVPGRTMLQKLVYLLGKVHGEDVEFAPHYYGPYSRGVREEVERLVEAGLLQETVKVYEPWQPMLFDVREYSYTLTPEGEQEALRLSRDLLTDAERLVRVAKSAAWSQEALAVAAKVLYLREEEPDADLADVPALARQLGWRISAAQAGQGLRLLRDLQLA